jgi:MFS family permease
MRFCRSTVAGLTQRGAAAPAKDRSPFTMQLALTRDGWLLFTSCGVRSFAYGFLSVALGLYLDALGLGTNVIGWIFTAAIAGGAVMTILVTSIADAFGRRALLVIGALLMAGAGCTFAIAADPTLLALAAIVGTISPSGKEVGPFLSLEQAMLPQTTSNENRTAMFSAYNLIGSLSGALGALAVGLPSLLEIRRSRDIVCWCGAMWPRRFCSRCVFLCYRPRSK